MTEPSAGAGQMLLTVFLKHRQSMNLAEINQKLEQTGFWKKFPPDGAALGARSSRRWRQKARCRPCSRGADRGLMWPRALTGTARRSTIGPSSPSLGSDLHLPWRARR
jgi:hypothetical protein